MTPVVRHDFRIGVPESGNWQEIFTSDAKEFWGSGTANPNPITSGFVNWHGRENSISITIPPLGASVFKRVKEVPKKYELK